MAPLSRTETTTLRSSDRLARVASTLCITSAALTGWLYVKPKTRGLTTYLIGYGLKIVAGALSPILSIAGFAGAILARRTRRPFAAFLGAVGSFLGARFIQRVVTPVDDFERAFGPQRLPPLALPPVAGEEDCPPLRAESSQRYSLPIEGRVPGEVEGKAGGRERLTRRWHWGQVTMAASPRMIRNLAFATIPGTDRELLCDLWQPGHDVVRSGVGVIYLHGGSWQAFDKDVATRPFFRHLTAQGHVVMDVAYRLARETDMQGMLGDAKRAIAWLKTKGMAFDVDPAKIVIAGGSAGGHLALLAAYTPNNPAFEPEDTQATDTSVRGVVAYYPVADLRTLSLLWSEQSMHPLATAIGRMLGYFPPEGYLPWSKLGPRLFGGPLADIGDALLAYSPLAHVGPHCPPTLLIQGLHDHIVPVQDVICLHRALAEAGCQAAIVELPMVEHAFDMVALQISPPAQSALYDVDRFLALMV